MVFGCFTVKGKKVSLFSGKWGGGRNKPPVFGKKR